MSFGPLFTLRPRARRANAGATDEPFPATEGWNERRARERPVPSFDTPKRRANDKPDREPDKR